MEVVTMLNNMYTVFDQISEQHNVYKVSVNYMFQQINLWSQKKLIYICPLPSGVRGATHYMGRFYLKAVPISSWSYIYYELKYRKVKRSVLGI